MSAATMAGSDVRASSSTSSKQQLKSSTTTSAKASDSARKQDGSPSEGQNKKQAAPPNRSAWQGGINPITQKAATSTPNGTADKTAPKSSPQPQPQQPSADADKHAHDRTLFLLASFMGLEATITTKTGEKFTGIFAGATVLPPKYTLKMVKKIRSSHTQVNGNVERETEYLGKEAEDHTMTFNKEDTIDLHVQNVAPATVRPTQNGSNGSFRTDAEISSAFAGRNRELERWQPDADSSIDMSLGDSSQTAGWDQFATNQRLYGVESTYDESIYTTEINRNDPRYRQREAEAARIAAEIEGTAPANAHVAEERRTDAVGEGLDEEEKYSGVQREPSTLPKRAAGAYIPPSQRTITNAPTVPGAPFDPSIISLTKPTTSQQPQKSAELAKTPELTQGQKTPQTEPPVKDSRFSTQTTAGSSKRSQVENTTEDHVRNVADSFKQFANNEKLRLRQAQETKRVTARAEKNVKINDLKKFAANFKLNTRVPDDLVPILAKDREKQIEIQHKAEEAYKDEEARRVDREKAKAAGIPSPVVPSSTTQAATTVPLDQQQQANKSRQAPRGAQFTGPMVSPGRTAGIPSGRGYGRPGFPPPPAPLPANLRMPPAPVANQDAGPLSPTKSLNAGAKAFEFRPGATNFTPTSVSRSPHRSPGKASATGSETVEFFKGRKFIDPKQMPSLDDAFNFLKKEYNEEQQKANAGNGGIPNPYRTGPKWPVGEGMENVTMKDSIPKPADPNHPPPLMHHPNQVPGQMPPAHQMPPHMAGPPPPQPSNRSNFMPNHHPHPPNYGPGMQQFGPNGSVQNSPRFPHAQPMPFNGQMPNMQMPQFPGQPQYGMSPSMQYRPMNVAPSGNMMMMPGHPQGGMPGMPQGYPPPQMQRPGPQGYNGQMMPNNGAPNFMPSYSPMPPHATPHMHPQQQHPYAASPRPPGHMMQQTHSQPGYNPNAHMGHMGGMPYAPSPAGLPGGPAGPYPHHPGMQGRHMSAGGYPQMTPRQGQVVPASMQPSPGAGGDEGK